jgi:hypothetical protein
MKEGEQERGEERCKYLPFSAHQHVAPVKRNKGHLHDNHIDKSGKDLMAIIPHPTF